jgi:hypothetical protein
MQVGENIYVKTEPRLIDWLNYQKYLLMIDESRMDKKDAALFAIINVVGSYMGLSRYEILNSELTKEEITDAYRKISENMNECFFKNNENNIQNRKIEISKEITESILQFAKDMFFKRGIIPDVFFNQTLQNFNMVMFLDDIQGNTIMDVAQADETGF